MDLIDPMDSILFVITDEEDLVVVVVVETSDSVDSR